MLVGSLENRALVVETPKVHSNGFNVFEQFERVPTDPEVERPNAVYLCLIFHLGMYTQYKFAGCVHAWIRIRAGSRIFHSPINSTSIMNQPAKLPTFLYLCLTP